MARADSFAKPKASISWLNRLAERRIQKAWLQGQLQGLSGEGKPLPDRPGDAFFYPGNAIGFRVMAQAWVLPEDIVLKKQAAALRAHLATVTDLAAPKAVLTLLEMQQAIAKEARRHLLKGQAGC